MNEQQRQAPLFEAVTSYKNKRPAYFCIPGHRYEQGISREWREQVGDGIFGYDLTEAQGLDDLHAPEGAIQKAQQLMAGLYHAKESFFLVNGTTCGNEAMLLAAVRPGEKVLVPRNAHKSVLMGLVLSGAVPVWMQAEYIQQPGLWGGVRPETVEAALKEDPKIRAVCLVSPVYHGFCSDISSIADVCHEHGIPLLVDEAHGGHLYFDSGLPRGALLQGADMCVQSFHKVTGALGQSSVLHIASDRVDPARVREALKLVQSTSPSYLLMVSLDLARRELALHGKQEMHALAQRSRRIREELRRQTPFGYPGEELVGSYGIADMDPSRLTIEVAASGMTGEEFRKKLFEEYNIDTELADGDTVLAILTAANGEEDYKRLMEALSALGKEKAKAARPETPAFPQQVPFAAMNPRDAWFALKRTIPWDEAAGCIAGEALIPYPPGIPLVCPGERITEEIWKYMEYFRKNGLHFHGPADQKLKTFRIIDR